MVRVRADIRASFVQPKLPHSNRHQAQPPSVTRRRLEGVGMRDADDERRTIPVSREGKFLLIVRVELRGPH